MEKTTTSLNLTSNETHKILKYCRYKLIELNTYLTNAKTLDDVINTINAFAEADWCFDRIINENENISYFSFIFDQLSVEGYVTPFGVILNKNVVYNIFDEDATLYNVDIEHNEINLF